MNKIKIKGTLNRPAFKIAALRKGAVKEENGLIFIEGYANTKNSADRYGDIPSPLTSKRSYVYELTQFKKNPVLLIDHVNRLDHLAGSVTEIHEDDKGLYFKALFSSSMHPTIAHARKLYQEGHAKGISIAGRFHYEDPHNPNKLTLAEIYEISLVAVPADPNSLAGMPRGGDSETDETENKEKTSALQAELTRWIEELKKD